MGGPYPYSRRVPDQDLIMLDNLHLDRTVPAQPALGDRTPEFPCDDMEPQTSSEHRKIKMEVSCRVPRTGEVRSSSEYQAAAPCRNIFGGHAVGDHPCIDRAIPEHPQDQVVELPEIIDNIYREHP